MAIAWVMARPGVTSPIASARTMEQMRTQLKQMGDALLAAEGAPNNKETAAFAELFSDDDSVDIAADSTAAINSPTTPGGSRFTM